MKYKRKPTKKQEATFKHMANALTLRDAMLAGGYSEKTAINPRANFIDRVGTKELIKEYVGHLERAGVSPEILAEIQAEGLFDQNAAIRLQYVKETKKDFGLSQDEPQLNNTQINITVTRSEQSL